MKLSGLEDPDEHGDVASPSANNLDSPAAGLRRKDRVFFPAAVADVPEEIAARATRSPCVVVWPRWEGQLVRCCATSDALGFRFCPAELLACATAEMERAYHKDTHRLDVHQYGR